MCSRPFMVAVTSIRYRASAIIIRVRAICRVTGVSKIEPPPNRRLPQPAESYHQSWSAQSAPLPAQSNVPVDPPAIIYAPQDNRHPEFRPRRPQTLR